MFCVAVGLSDGAFLRSALLLFYIGKNARMKPSGLCSCWRD